MENLDVPLSQTRVKLYVEIKKLVEDDSGNIKIISKNLKENIYILKHDKMAIKLFDYDEEHIMREINGAKIANRLREYSVVAGLVYGYALCDYSPVTKQRGTFFYLFMEYQQPIKPNKMIGPFLELLIAVYIGRKRFNFRHNDIADQNIIFVDGGDTNRYYLAGPSLYKFSGPIPRLIDFEFATTEPNKSKPEARGDVRSILSTWWIYTKDYKFPAIFEDYLRKALFVTWDGRIRGGLYDTDNSSNLKNVLNIIEDPIFEGYRNEDSSAFKDALNILKQLPPVMDIQADRGAVVDEELATAQFGYYDDPINYYSELEEIRVSLDKYISIECGRGEEEGKKRLKSCITCKIPIRNDQLVCGICQLTHQLLK